MMLLGFLLAACSTAPTATPISSPTIDIAPTLTRTAEMALISSLRATIAAPTTTPIAPTASSPNTDGDGHFH
ncbi:MAG: hypothetical protein U0841_33810 [Chloroflexia bacterium]